MAHRFRTTVEQHQKTATFLRVPPAIVERLGPKQRVPVRVTINGYTYRSTIAPMGGEFFLPLSRQNRDGARVAAGDTVAVTIERDTEPRVVDVPADLAAALKSDRAAAKSFAALSYSHRREYAEWIAAAKRQDTRQRRVAKALVMLRDGKPAR
jgi:hypothetical protein